MKIQSLVIGMAVFRMKLMNNYSGIKYNSKGGRIAGSYRWINGNSGDLDAHKFRGRGFKMLTGLDACSSYWVYRG